MNDLIDEQDLRDAFESLRPEPDVFEAGVRNRLKARALREAPNDRAHKNSPWLQVAASMVPLSLLGKTAGSSVSIPMGKISLGYKFMGYKLLGYAALPALSVMIMVGATLLAFFRIRKAQISRPSDSPDAVQEQSVILTSWWQSYGFIPVCLCFIALVAFLMGYTFPVFLFFLGSGAAMVALVTRLGRSGLIDRGIVGGTLCSSLIGLAQITQITNIFDSGCHLLDQGLVMMILLVAGIVLGIVLTLQKWNGLRTVLLTTVQTVAALLVFGFFGGSLWNPMSAEKVKNYVESFEKARFSSSNWNHWAVPAIWLQQSGVPLNLSKPRSLLETEIAGEQNPFIIGVASRTNLLTTDDFLRIRDPFDQRRRLLDSIDRDQAILSIEQREFTIRAIVLANQWKEGELDILESRLLATIRYSLTREYIGLEEALIATNLLKLIGRPCNEPSVRQQIQKTLVTLQRTRFRLGGRNGGFARYPKSAHSDLLATAYSVELMEHYGVPVDLNLMAIRSFLRPAIIDIYVIEQAAVRAAIKMRMENLTAVPPLTWWDYFHYEPSILMALVFAMLCFFATLGCPNQLIRSGDSQSYHLEPIAQLR